MGRNLTHQVSFGAAQAFFEKPFSNRFMGSAASGMRGISDFDGDVFDHAELPFLRGGTFSAMIMGYQPISTSECCRRPADSLGFRVENRRSIITTGGAEAACAGEHLAL